MGPHGCQSVSLRRSMTRIKAHHRKETEGHMLMPRLLFVLELECKV